MPKDLTDASQWDTTAVPVGTDPATSASVETPFQLLTNRAKYLFDRIVGALALNFFAGDTSTPGTFGAGISAKTSRIEYDPTTGYWTFPVDGDGAGNPPEEAYSKNGITWEKNAPAGWANATAQGHSVNQTTGYRAVSIFGNDQLWRSVNTHAGTWILWNGIGATGKQYTLIGNDGARWVVYNSTDSTLMYTDDVTATPPAAGATQPGFAGAVTFVDHSRHAAAEVDPSDPGNLVWLAITATEASRSADGNTWTAAAAHGIAAPAGSLAYTARSQLWHALDTTAGNLQLYTSDDNGDTWAGGTVIWAPANIMRAAIASDRLGSLVVIATDTVTDETRAYASIDDGDTWTRIALPGDHFPGVPSWTRYPLAGFGGGRFMLVAEDGAAPATYSPFYGLTMSGD